MTLEERQDFLKKTFYNLRTRGVVCNWSDFAEKAGINRSYLSSAKNGDEKCLTDSLIFRVKSFADRYLGNNIHVNGSSNNIATDNAMIISGGADTPQVLPDDSELVPVIPTKLYNDPHTSVIEYLEQGHDDIQMQPPIMQFGPTTCFKVCNSDSMYPDIRPGDLLALLVVDRSAPIMFGETYVIDLRGVGLILRIVDEFSDSELLLTAKNERYGPVRIKKSDIMTLFRIVGYTRTNI